MTTAENIKAALAQRSIQEEFDAALNSVRSKIQFGVYPNLVAFLAHIDGLYASVEAGGKFEAFAADPTLALIKEIATGAALAELREAKAAIEAIELATTPEGESEGVFRLSINTGE